MTFLQAVQSAFKNYINFQGRAARSEYWWFVLFNIACQLIPYFLMAGESAKGHPGVFTGLYWLISLAFLLPGLGLAVRRLHDTDRSGWWILVGLIPVAGLILIYWLAIKGTPGTNKFGADRLSAGVVNTF